MTTSIADVMSAARRPTNLSPELNPTAAKLQEQFRQVRNLTERLAEPLETEDYVIQSMSDASPVKWHLAHTTWFFETFVLAAMIRDYRPVASTYGYLFNSYYNTVGPMHCRDRRGMLSRPTVKETFDYRQRVDEQMRSLIEAHLGSSSDRLAALVLLGLNHEQQHQELLLTDIKHAFGQNPLFPAYHSRRPVPDRTVPALSWESYPEGVFWIGHDGTGFAYDNEGPRHRQFVAPFALSNRLVTNEEFLAFIEDGGYHCPQWWLSLGWQTASQQRWKAPLYWETSEGDWLCFTLDGVRKVDMAEPVCHVSYFEADAFARWAGARLPTETEWELAASGNTIQGNLIESGAYHPLPAGEVATAGGKGLRQMYGDVWEWTQSAYGPYPGYQPRPGAIGEYNGKFMCGQMVLRGGSCATSRSHIRSTYRNFFPPDKRWQFSGIRLAKDLS